MFRTPSLLFALTACGGPPGVQVGQDALRHDASGDLITSEAVATAMDHVGAVCAFHAQPSCVASRAATCDDGLVLADPAVCHDLLQDTVLACPGAAEQLHAHRTEVQACAAHLASTTCDASPACAADGVPLDATGPCETVTDIVRTACADLVDPE